MKKLDRLSLLFERNTQDSQPLLELGWSGFLLGCGLELNMAHLSSIAPLMHALLCSISSGLTQCILKTKET